MANLMTKEFMDDVQHSQQLCQILMKTPHYAKIGPDGLFAIIEAAKAFNIDLRQALGGGFHYIKNKAEMSAHLMSSIIRAHKHSITKNERSDETICILHGRRADNGDTWTDSFSIEDAKQAGLLNNSVWRTFTKDLLYARALKRLANHLYSDLIKNVAGEGELSLDPNIIAEEGIIIPEPEKNELLFKVSNEEVAELESLIGDDDKYRQNILRFLGNNCKGSSFHDMPKEIYEKVYAQALKNKQEREKVDQDICHYGEINQMAMGDA